MKLFQSLSIKNKLIAIILIVSVVILLSGFTFVIINEIITYRKSMVNVFTTQTKLISEYCVPALTFNDKKGATEITVRL